MTLIKTITRTDRKSNGKEVRHQVDKKETYIQTGRRGGDGGTWAERTRVAMVGPRLAECGTNPGRQSDHQQTLQPHIPAQINQEGRTQSGGEWVRQSSG